MRLCCVCVVFVCVCVVFVCVSVVFVCVSAVFVCVVVSACVVYAWKNVLDSV